MKCQCCDRFLSDYESTARHQETNQFLDMCIKCIKEVGIPFIGRKDLDPSLNPEEEIIREELDF